MSTTSISTSDVGRGADPGDADRGYDGFRRRVQGRFLARLKDDGGAMFTTDATGLFEAYLDGLPSARQYHTCSACRRFFEAYGGLVTIDAEGRAHPALWHIDDAPAFYRPAVVAVYRLVARAKVTGVFVGKADVWGRPVTGPWTHFAVTPPAATLLRSPLLTPGQAMAEKREDYRQVQRALAEFTAPMLDQALTLLRSEALYRSEKVIGPAQWLHDLHAARLPRHGPAKDNLTWRAVASAPPGFCHPRSSMVGTLLEDLAAGMDFAGVSRRFAAKMHPLQYQRPQAALTAGNIAAAERLVETLGIARSLERRFARLDEVEAVWRPAPPRPETPRGGVFGHLILRGAAPATPGIVPPPITMTWAKFARDVLPAAEAIAFLVPTHGNFAALLTAVHADAPPILQWDSPARRNPVSWYLYMGGSAAVQWGLVGGIWHAVTAVALKPSQWGPDPDAFPHQGRGIVLVLDGARDSRQAGNGLFPETLKSDLHAVRATVERYSRAATLAGAEEASACGIMLPQGTPWDAVVRVTAGPSVLQYRLDRWD